MNKSYLTVTDQFCGAGGSSLGAVAAGCEVTLAMNHWRLAIETHNTNFPQTTHVCADIQQVDPRRYPSTDILITSPECTNHSLAKGKKRKNIAQLDMFSGSQIDPAEERSRATMWDVPRFAEYHRYRYIIVENVVDARHWVLFDTWIQAMHVLGYDYRILYINSQFMPPTPQSRDRLYVVFWLRGHRPPQLDFRPSAYCPRCDTTVAAVQVWKNPQRQWGRYRTQYVYRCPGCAQIVRPFYSPAFTAIDWSLPAERIGDREKPLKPRTLDRIRYGLRKFSQQPVLVPLSHTHAGAARGHATADPFPTQTGQQTLGLLMPFLMSYYSREDASSRIDDAMPTVTTEPRHSLVMPFLFSYYGERHATLSATDPLPTMTSFDNHALVTPFITSVNHSNDRAQSVGDPLPTVMTQARPSLVVPPFLIELYRTGGARAVDEAFSTILAGGNHHGLILPFLASYYGSETTQTVVEAMRTVTTVDRHALIEPGDELRVEDCGFRMIEPHEIQTAMAFPTSYVVKGNKRERVKQLGNAVTPPVMSWLIERVVEALA